MYCAGKRTGKRAGILLSTYQGGNLIRGQQFTACLITCLLTINADRRDNWSHHFLKRIKIDLDADL